MRVQQLLILAVVAPLLGCSGDGSGEAGGDGPGGDGANGGGAGDGSVGSGGSAANANVGGGGGSAANANVGGGGGGGGAGGYAGVDPWPGVDAVVLIADGVDVNFLTFEGTQKWVGGQHGLYWKDTTSTAESSHVRLKNVKSTGATSSDGYLVYLERNGTLRNLTLEECDGSDRSGGFLYARNLENVLMKSCRYQNEGKFVNAASCYGINYEAANVSDSAQIDIPDMTKSFSVDGATGSKNVHGIWVRQPQ